MELPMKTVRLIIDFFIIASVIVLEYFFPSIKISTISIIIILSLLIIRYQLSKTEKIGGKEIIFLTICFLSLMLMKWYLISSFIVFSSLLPLILFISFFGRKFIRSPLLKRGLIIIFTVIIILIIFIFLNECPSTSTYWACFAYILFQVDEFNK